MDDKLTQQIVNKMYGEEVDPLERARREGVIEGLEIALGLFPKPNSTTRWSPQDAIRAEIEHLKKNV